MNASSNISFLQVLGSILKQGIAIVVVVGVISGIYYYLEHGSEPEPEMQESEVPQQQLEVSTVVVESKTIPLKLEFLGQTEASETVEIRSRIRGFLDERLFEEGSEVEKDKLLYQIDPRSFQASLDIARAQLANTKARLKRAQQQVDRYKTLVSQNAATNNELEEWQTQADVAEAEVELANAQVRQAELDLSYTKIISPITGMIGESLKDVGTYVDDSSNSLLAYVKQVDPIFVRFSVSESEMVQWQQLIDTNKLQVPEEGTIPVTITLTDNVPYPHEGVINFVDIDVDPSTGTAFIRATVPNPDNVLRPGQYVDVQVQGIYKNNSILVPQESVMQTPTGSSIYTVSQDGTVEQQVVTLGDWYEDQWIIEEGLNAGDRIIIDQLMKVRPGIPVKFTDTSEQVTNVSQQKS